MRIDAHQHFWVYDRQQYAWIDERHQSICKDFLPADLIPHLRENGMEGCIAVQARQSLRETEWLLQLAEQNSIIKGVIGWVDLCSDDVERQLHTLSSNPILKGVRHVIHDEPDPLFMLRKEFRRGISLLEQYGLTYDLLLFPRHLRHAFELVREFPKQPFVLDHIGKPDIAHSQLQPWKDDLSRLAQHQNVNCKLSGMVTETRLNQWQEADFEPYLDIVFDAFGFDRLMIGSDWPVCTISGSYASVMQIVIHYIRRFSCSVQEQILGGNCTQFYRLE